MKIFNNYNGGPVEADIELGSNGLKTTDLLLKQDTSNQFILRDNADTANRDLVLRRMYFYLSLLAQVDGVGIEAYNSDGCHFKFSARDTGVGIIEVARLQGAADPYFQTTLPMVMLPIATGSLPGTPVNGMVHYDATLNKLVVYTGAGWETVTSV